jgi:collagen type VII alpha
MADIKDQLIKDSYNYVLQSDLSTGVVYRIGGDVPVNPIFQSGLTINDRFVYANGTEGVGYTLVTDGTGYAYWAPVSAATPSSGVTSITATNGLSGNVTTGAVTIVNTAPDRTVTISGGTGITTGGTYPNFTIVNSAPDRTVTITGGTSIEITGSYPDFGVNYTGLTTIQGITGITGTSGVSASTTDYGTTIINTAPDQTVTISGGTGITTGGTYPNFTLVNSAPDRTVTITGGTNIQITGTYPDFGVNFTGTTTGGTVSGDYLPLSGGTVTGGTIFQSGLTANTISATTYFNLPIDVYVTGGTYSGSNILFTNNTGGTFTVTGLTASGLSANYYASFSDNTNQVVSGANTPTVWRYNRTELSNGISLSGGTKIVVQNTGVYEIGYSAQIERTSSAGGDADVTIWASINDTPVERSSSTVTLVANSAYQLPFVSYIFELNAGDDVEFYFSSNSQYVRLAALSGLTSPTRPDAPSLIVVAKQIGTSVSVGSTGDTYVTGFTLNSNTVTLSQNRTDQYSAFTISLSAYTGSTTIQGITGITGTSGVSASTTDYGTTIINTAPDQTVIITGGTNIQITGTYPSFGVNFTGSTTGGTAIQGITGITGTSGVSANTTDYGTTIINTAPDRTVTITGGTNVQITGTYPDFGVNFTGTSATDTYVTGFTLSSNTITLSQNRSDSYSAFTISLSAYTGSTGGGVGGSGTTSYVPKWSNSTTLTDSKIYDNGTSIGVGTASPNAAAIVEIASTTQGVLFPRMTKVQRDAITSPPIGLMLFVTDDNEGLYIYKTSGWVQII